MTRPFAAFVAAEPPRVQPLPAVHTMDAWRLRVAMADFGVALGNEVCDVYGEQLTYLFYGRPAYRGHNKESSVSIKSMYLVSFVFDHATLPPLKRVMPFDTGAFHRNLFLGSMHPQMKITDFEVTPAIDSARQIVTRFFGNNTAYWRGKARPDMPNFGFTFEAESYAELISGHASSEYDDRRAAIELQVQCNIDFAATRVLAVALPEVLADEAAVQAFLAKTGAECLPYECYHARQAEDTRAIVERTYKFLSEKGLI